MADSRCAAALRLIALSSRDLADSKAEFVAADSLLKLANANLKRERDLYKSKVTAKREYLAARQVQVEMSIKRKAAAQRTSTDRYLLSLMNKGQIFLINCQINPNLR
jgi:hypothetical protein